MNHDEKPQHLEVVPEQVQQQIEKLLNSEYRRYVEALPEHVVGKVVIESAGGRSGFQLLFADGTWVVCYVQTGALRYTVGAGVVEPALQAVMNDVAVADGSSRLEADVPYAGELCDIAAEAAKAQGRVVTGLAIGERSFNFCFPDGRELDASIWHNQEGREIFRLFWEQW